MAKNRDKDFYFFDESRFGTHSKLGHGWFKKGTRPRVRIKLGFKNFYVYSATHSKTGEHFSLIIPYLNTECMNIFLEELSKHLGSRIATIVMDQAAWHKSSTLAIPNNINIVYLPPYCPELNPVERLWRYIKHHIIRNKVYDSIDELENRLSNFMKNLDKPTIQNICSFQY